MTTAPKLTGSQQAVIDWLATSPFGHATRLQPSSPPRSARISATEQVLVENHPAKRQNSITQWPYGVAQGGTILVSIA